MKAIVLALALYVCLLAVDYYYRLRSIQRHHLESGWMWFVAAILLMTVSLSSPRSAEAVEDDSWRVPRYLPLLLIAAAMAAYYPALHLGFLSDDFALSALAARNEFLGRSWAFLRPVPLMCYKAAGAHPFALHALVIVLHGVNAALVVRLATIFGVAPRQAAVAGLLFVTFPASLEAVAWCAGVQDVLMTTGVLAAIVAATVSGGAFSLAALAAALFCKETAVAAPFLMWLSDRRRWRTALAALIVAGAYAAWRVATRPLAEGYAATPTAYAFKELLVRPFGTLAVPFRGAQLAQWPLLGVLLVGGLALLLARAASAWSGDRRRIFLGAAAGLWVIASVAPVYSMFDVSGTLQGSRYVYLATAGWSILLAAVLLPGRARVDRALVAAVCTLGIAGIRVNLVPWTHAARMRDEVLAAVERATSAGCTAVWIRNVPDSTQGAYVFRNGLAQAIAPTALTSSAPPNCWISVPFGS